MVRERVKPFFDPKGKVQIVVTANPSRVENIVDGFKQIGFDDVEIVDFEGMVDEAGKGGLSVSSE